MAPFGQIPLLEDPDSSISIYESRLVSRYLCLKYNTIEPVLIADAKDIKASMSFEQSIAVETEEFNTVAERLCMIILIDP
jgi:glutathione S-transferase